MELPIKSQVKTDREADQRYARSLAEEEQATAVCDEGRLSRRHRGLPETLQVIKMCKIWIESKGLET